MFKTTSIEQYYEINVISAELAMLEESTKDKNVAYWLKYLRKSENISQQTLADRIGIAHNNYIKQIETAQCYPNKETSLKLAKYFNLDTKYFYDPYYEDTDNYTEVLINYRKEHNLLIKEAAALVKVSPGTWSCWEKGKYFITRDKYLILKEAGIF